MTKNEKTISAADLSCPAPINTYPTVLLAHGGGGTLTQQLIKTLFLPQFANEYLDQLHDGAVVPLGGKRFAFSTDAFVVNPIFFPGGSIGDLAVNGTVNDLAMCGARPLFLAVSFIVEEGLAMEELQRVVTDMHRAAAAAGVQIVTGDTKVVDRGKGDKIFVTTSGIGLVDDGVMVGSQNAKPGDKILINGTIGDHGIAIMSVREGLEFDAPVRSDSAPLNHLVEALLKEIPVLHVLRDPTRGGVASALNEIAGSSGVGIQIREDVLPMKESVKGACEILGLDPLYVANEGKLIAFVPARSADRALAIMRQHPLGKEAAIIGEVVDRHPGTVVMQSSVGGKRVVDMLSGEQLPRIC